MQFQSTIYLLFPFSCSLFSFKLWAKNHNSWKDFYTYAKSVLLTRDLCLHVLWEAVKKGTGKHGGDFLLLLNPAWMCCFGGMVLRVLSAGFLTPNAEGVLGWMGVSVSACKQRCFPSLSSCLVRNPATAIGTAIRPFWYKMQAGERQNHIIYMVCTSITVW